MTDLCDHEDTTPTLDGHLPTPEPTVRTTTTVVAWAARSEVGLGRGENQDRWDHQGKERFVLADGMGGHADGGAAAATACATLRDTGTGSWWDRVAVANDAVRARAAASAGTTVLVLEVTDGCATVVSVGDSRVYRARAGRLEQLTEDHTLRGELLTAGIDADRHATVRQTRGLTSYLGIEPGRLRVDVVAVPVVAGDRFLLCSDGLHDTLAPTALGDALHAGSCADSVERLFAARAAIGGRDDATAVVVDVA